MPFVGCVGYGKDEVKWALAIDRCGSGGDAMPGVGIGAPIWRGISWPRGVMGWEG